MAAVLHPKVKKGQHGPLYLWYASTGTGMQPPSHDQDRPSLETATFLYEAAAPDPTRHGHPLLLWRVHNVW